ncbi:MAG: 30S ribosomal protein S20 [Bacteroidales bacterium]|jgi:small subunit ribosomal protein S20|nr:30S ribosomal protein S20 [Bacteroidales bacterium]MDD2204822.1 30S ribosomal protein S20 [Bacteroidales bacterium]MDD3152619.1 30S ribosomal protein S20 [Bacteroidales bacterium]MDD3914352.1 30S ribosomal protein S20 [Bacteroidales bacterium]MDD4634099.1 30S ribosomal protein S20 [Bacteroidales bacterium]
MANHKSAIKRIRQTEKRRVYRRYYAKTMRNAVKKFRLITDKEEATAQLPKVSSMLDKMVSKNIIHKNKAGNLKSKLARKANALG